MKLFKKFRKRRAVKKMLKALPKRRKYSHSPILYKQMVGRAERGKTIGKVVSNE